ncbi:MAG: ATP synthase F1 subunit gamma [Deltaproteobacteria bacterium]|nr:ATP synthase F1 subunit gamma [Deltaproteobacteria bacterium]
MPSLKAIRTRIVSVKNTQKITRAMKLVAAARLRRAQEAILAARPYAQALEDVIAEIGARAGRSAHPLLSERPARRVELVVVTSDRGLAGAFNSNALRQAERYVYEHAGDHEAIQIAVLGRKGREYLRRRRVNVISERPGVTSQVAKERADEIANDILARYTAREVDAVYLVYNEFKSAISQKTLVERLLPIKPKALPQGATPIDYIYEPSKEAVLDHILPMHVQVQIYRALLESVASEFGARMSAMDNATSNASEMIGKLTLQYNRARQAAITKELLEIIGGAEALKG